MLGSSSIMRSLILHEFEKQGCIPNIVSNHEQISCMIQMIHLGNYIGFINTDKRHMASGCSDLVIRPLANPVYMKPDLSRKKIKHLHDWKTKWSPSYSLFIPEFLLTCKKPMALTVSSLNHRFCSVQMITEPCFVLHNPSPQKWNPLYYSCHNIPTDKNQCGYCPFSLL